MNDQQLMTLCIAVILPLSMLIYSNSRITEAKETLRAEMATMRAELGAEISGLRAEMRLDFERLNNKIDHLADLMATHLADHHKH